MNGNLECNDCPEPCTKCFAEDDNIICTECDERFLLDEETSSCSTSCAEGYTADINAEGEFTCCEEGYYGNFANGPLECDLCAYPCSKCSTGACFACFDPYILNGETSLCTDCVEGWEYVDGECIEILCESGYYRDWDYYGIFICSECEYPCIQCEEEGWCTECTFPFVVDMNEHICSICESGYYEGGFMDGVYTCIPCVSPCTLCESDTEC